MNARDCRRLNEAAGVLMTTKGMDPTRAVLEAARQLGYLPGRPSPHQGTANLEGLVALLGGSALRRQFPAEVDAIVAYLEGSSTRELLAARE